jgi:hypothetical protein
MTKSCIVCRAVASQDILLQYCDACQSAVYCSRACQRKDWKKRHRKICKFLNVGHGDMQVCTEVHEGRSIHAKKRLEREKLDLDEDGKQFFKLFQESAFEGSQAAALEMMNIAKRHTKGYQKFLLFYSLNFLVHFSNSEMLSWPNSPLLVLLQLVDSNELAGMQEGEARDTWLHHLTRLVDHFDYSTHVNQLVLAKQLIERGAEVNAVSIPHDVTPLHAACYGGNVTNLDFVELLLEEGADVNAQDHLGNTPLMYATPHAPGAAKFLLNWPTTDINIINARGESILVRARGDVKFFSDKVALPDNPERVHHKFVLRQWRKIEKMLVEMGAHDTGIAALE